ncbi:glycerophosphodiester phosphodiesterase family protein [Actinomadura sp. LOL_016]|uniref:glycerophosphodiester phosphodiesterase family protein n=1 Tax=unclassified Actinomadura TaxID=2626254 RepID=UPI003A80C708
MTRTVELHGHRGARGLLPENTLPGFAHALDLGVHAIEFDVGLSADGVVVLGHDQTLSPVTLTDTAPAHPGDPAFPYVGKAVRDLTLAQLKTLEAGTRNPTPAPGTARPSPRQAGTPAAGAGLAGDDGDLVGGDGVRGSDAGDGWWFGDAFAVTQRAVPGTSIPTLAEVCRLVEPSRVELAVELKTDPTWTDADIARFVSAVVDVLDGAGLVARSRLLAFDWRVLTRTPRELGRVALVERKTLVPASPWLAGLPARDPVSSAVAVGATALSPEHVITTPGLVDDAHAAGLPVAVWTVNEPEDMTRFAKYGVDAIVTDYPDVALAVPGLVSSASAPA